MRHGRRAWPGPDQLVLRSVVVLATGAVVLATVAAGGRPHPLLPLGLLGLALLTSAWPDSSAGLGLLAGCALLWTRVPEPLSGWVLLAAAGTVAAHVAALVAAQGPARMAVDPGQVRLWSVRAGATWLAAVLVWAAATAAERGPEHRLVFASGLVLLVVLALAAAHGFTGRSRPS
jgi:hypothetical protein